MRKGCDGGGKKTGGETGRKKKEKTDDEFFGCLQTDGDGKVLTKIVTVRAKLHQRLNPDLWNLFNNERHQLKSSK